MAHEIGITNNDITGEAVAETAGGDVATVETMIKLQIRCELSGEIVLIEGINASVSKSEVVLIGNSVVQYIDVLLKNGQLALLALARESQLIYSTHDNFRRGDISKDQLALRRRFVQ